MLFIILLSSNDEYSTTQSHTGLLEYSNYYEDHPIRMIPNRGDYDKQ